MFWTNLQNNRRTVRVVAVALTGFLFFFSGTTTYGVEENVHPDCDFAPLLADLTAITQDSARDLQDRIRAELETRKQLLHRTIQCALFDASNIRTKVSGIPSTDQNAAPLRTQFVSAIDNILNHYADIERSIDTMGIGGTQDAARDLREWRANTAAPLLGEALNFIVWAQNQGLFAAAHTRFTDMTGVLRSLHLHEDDAIAGLLAEASRNLAAADDLNTQVRLSLAEFPPASDTLDNIKESLSELASAYANFFDLSEAAHKLIPGAR